MMMFIHSFQSEWLKRKRSLASWLVVAGALFTPAIILLARIKNYDGLPKLYAAEDFWQRSLVQSWESMAVFLLPVGVILATGLICQIEFKNNTWKQLHTTPQSLTTIYLAKFLVIIVMLAQVFILFNIAVYLSALIPAILFSSVPYPTAPLPFEQLWGMSVNFFIDCLPIVALQYLISLHFKNFLVPVGTGFAIWFLGVGLLSWKYSYLLPYNHGPVSFMQMSGHFANRAIPVNMELLALVYFVVFFVAGWFMYIYKADKA